MIQSITRTLYVEKGTRTLPRLILAFKGTRCMVWHRDSPSIPHLIWVMTEKAYIPFPQIYSIRFVFAQLINRWIRDIYLIIIYVVYIKHRICFVVILNMQTSRQGVYIRDIYNNEHDDGVHCIYNKREQNQPYI